MLPPPWRIVPPVSPMSPVPEQVMHCSPLVLPVPWHISQGIFTARLTACITYSMSAKGSGAAGVQPVPGSGLGERLRRVADVGSEVLAAVAGHRRRQAAVAAAVMARDRAAAGVDQGAGAVTVAARHEAVAAAASGGSAVEVAEARGAAVGHTGH